MSRRLVLDTVCSCLLTPLALVVANGGAAPVSDELSPRLSWVHTEGFRLGYNYCAPLDWYARAKACGMNGIISRLEIANDRSGDEAISGNYPDEGPMPDAVRCWRLLRPSSKLAREHGVRFFYMLNLGGSRGNIDQGFRDNPRRFNNGKLFSPLDEVYWRRVVENRFLRVAERLRGDEYQLDGFLIDPEMYAETGATPGDVDYGDFALSEFVRATGDELAFEGLSIPDRQQLIVDRGLKDKLYDFEFERVSALARRTRERLHAEAPDAILGFFLWKDMLWYKATAAGFATSRVPCFVGPESTYPGAFDDQFLRYRDEVQQQAGVPLFFVPGLRFGFENDAVPTAFLKVLPGNLFHRSLNTSGYWYWAVSRLGNTDEERKPFLNVLQAVNTELDRYHAAAGKYESPLRPAALPVERPRNLQDLLLNVRSWQPVPQDALPDDAPPPTGATLRGLFAFIVLAEKGDEIALQVRNVRLGRYTAPTACTFFRPDGSSLPQQDVGLSQQQRVTQTADPGGVWVVGLTSHNNAFRVLPEARHCALVHDGPIALCKAPRGETLSRLFFYVPRATKQFRIAMRAYQAEVATFRVFNSAGEQVFEHVKLAGEVAPQFDTGPHAGKVWRIETTDAVEDHSFELRDIPNVVAAGPEQLLVPEL